MNNQMNLRIIYRAFCATDDTKQPLLQTIFIKKGNAMDLLNLTAVELGKEIKAGNATAVEAMEAVIAQIEKTEDNLNCYVTFDKETALANAKAADEAIKAGKLNGPLAGVPVAIKDNMCTKGMLTTCSSKILRTSCLHFHQKQLLSLRRLELL